MTYPVKHISISINRPVADVYRFTSNPENLPKWASGFFKSVVRQGNSWIGKTDIGDVTISFSPKNYFGILDHQVVIPGGEKFDNPMRVIANNKGSEIIFILFWLPERTEAEFNEDAMTVLRDLQKLKALLEHKSQ